jgi:CRP-like cAMP-binding protein
MFAINVSCGHWRILHKHHSPRRSHSAFLPPGECNISRGNKMVILPHDRINRTNGGANGTPPTENPRNKILEALPDSEASAIWSIGDEVDVQKGELISAAGAPYRHVFFAENCAFSFVTDLANGNSVEAGTVGNEGFLGIPILLGGDSVLQRTIVQIPGKACRIPIAAFRDVMPACPQMMLMLNRYLLAYLAQVSQTSACNSQHTILQRCARWILLTHDRVGSDMIPLTQEFLAYMLGVRRPSVTVAQAQLQRKGLISYTRGKLRVVDRQALEDLSCECYKVVRGEFQKLTGVSVA